MPSTHLKFFASVLASGILLTGCSIKESSLSASGDPRHSPRFSEFMRSQTVHVDLTKPPARGAVGMGPQADAVIVERTGKDMLDVDFVLPEGNRLHVPAFGVVFHTDVADPDTAPPRGIVVNRRVPSLADAHTALLSDVRALGIPLGEVDDWYDEQSRPVHIDNSGVGPATIGYLTTLIETRRYDDGKVVLNYKLFW